MTQRFFAHIFFSFLGVLFFGCMSAAHAGEKDFWADMGVARIGGGKPVPAPDFTLTTSDGKRVSLKDFRGKAVFLNFWATWCLPCTFEMPSMESLHRRFKDKGLVVVAVNFEESAKKVGSFIKKKGYTFLVLLDTDGSVANESYKAIGFPTTYLIDRRGLAIGKAEGAREWDSKESLRLMEEILKK